jgi:hypothetical protein
MEQLCFQFWFATPISFIWIKSLLGANWLIARSNNLKIPMSFSIRAARFRMGRKRAGAWFTSSRRSSSRKYARDFVGATVSLRIRPNISACISLYFIELHGYF